MNTPQDTRRNRDRRRKGQTMVEFAMTLPIMLLMVFGIIEFGRIFQAWVTLQNSARNAARYASTGQFDRDKYVLNENLERDDDSIVHCTLNADERGTTVQYSYDADTVDGFDGNEGLFATWYDGENCEPNRIDHQDMRKDIARILSIMDAAREGAAGLALGPDPLDGVDTQAEVESFLYGLWDRPVPGSGEYYQHAGYDQPNFFDVMICSSRAPRNDPATVTDGNYQTRFVTILDPNEDPGGFDPDLTQDGLNLDRVPVCVMNEIATAGLDHHGIPWLDAGGPGDAVTIVVTFNHPLITPLGLAPYVRLQARRAAVNEAFRAAEATGALQGGPAITADINEPPIAVLRAQSSYGVVDNVIRLPEGVATADIQLDGCDSIDQDEGHIIRWEYTENLAGGAVKPLGVRNVGDPCQHDSAAFPINYPPGTYNFVLRVTDNEGAEDTVQLTILVLGPEPTAVPTSPFTPIPTSTDLSPFDCNLITVGNVEFFNNRVYFEIYNGNFLPTEVVRVNFNWRKVPAFPNMHVSGMALDGTLVWKGQDFTPSTDTHVDASVPDGMFFSANRRINGNTHAQWESVFSNGPAPIQDPFNGIYWMTQYDFAGSEFTFDNPESDTNCVRLLELPTPTPSPTTNPSANSPTPSWTPDCAGSEVRIRFAGFAAPGAVRLTVTNLRTVPAEFVAFNINWVAHTGQNLEYVLAGGNSVFDTTNGVIVWQGSGSGDATPPTASTEPTWITNYSFPPSSTTNLWIKFGVTAAPPNQAWGMAPSDLNGSWFELGCGTDPDGTEGDGGFYGGTGIIHIFEEPSPLPSNTQGPTNTVPPTFTPSRTYTPSRTFTPSQVPSITMTRTPSRTPTASPTTAEPPPDGGEDVEGPDG